MELNSYKLGDLLSLCDDRNIDNFYTLDDVKGISIKKEFIETKADMAGVSLSPYILVRPDSFAYVTVTSRNGEKITLAHNTSEDTYIVSSSYVVFRVKRTDILLSDYLFMYFNRPEFDRFSRYNSWGSARETFSWEDMCDIDITLPDIKEQEKYVNIYLSLQDNLAIYQSKIDDLKVACEGYIEDLRKHYESEEIGQYLRSVDERNEDLAISLTQGVDVNMQFIPAKREAEDQEETKIVRTGQFAFNKVVKSNGTKLPFALRYGPDCVISSSYEVFEVVDRKKLHPEYLMLWMSRTETQRQCGFKSQGTTRDVFSFDDLCHLRFPIPDINIQKNVANIYQSYIERQRIANLLGEKIKNMCPILIKGSLVKA